MTQKVDNEIDRLLKEDIIEPIEISDWDAPVVPILKGDGSIRLCGNYKVTVNKVAEMDTYPIPNIRDLYAKLRGGNLFTNLDMSKAYEQLSLDVESRKYVTINTRRVLYLLIKECHMVYLLHRVSFNVLLIHCFKEYQMFFVILMTY